MMPTIDYQAHLRGIFVSLLFIFSSIQSSALLAAPTWQGPYAGIYLGGGFGNNHTSTNAGTVTNTSYFATTADINAVNNAASSTNHPRSAIIGIQAGHDWVWKQIVYGIVFDYGALPLSSSNTVNATYPDNPDQYSVHTSMSTNWLFTLRGRLGYPTTLHWPNVPSLPYLTGGMAMTQLKVNNRFTDNSAYSGMGNSQSAENKIGWTLGAGIELASFDHASVTLEYLYVHIPSVNTTAFISNTESGFGVPAQSLTSPLKTSGQFHASALKLELNYRFDE